MRAFLWLLVAWWPTAAPCDVVDADGDALDLTGLGGDTRAAGPGPTSCTTYPNCDWIYRFDLCGSLFTESRCLGGSQNVAMRWEDEPISGPSPICQDMGGTALPTFSRIESEEPGGLQAEFSGPGSYSLTVRILCDESAGDPGEVSRAAEVFTSGQATLDWCVCLAVVRRSVPWGPLNARSCRRLTPAARCMLSGVDRYTSSAVVCPAGSAAGWVIVGVILGVSGVYACAGIAYGRQLNLPNEGDGALSHPEKGGLMGCLHWHPHIAWWQQLPQLVMDGWHFTLVQAGLRKSDDPYMQIDEDPEADQLYAEQLAARKSTNYSKEVTFDPAAKSAPAADKPKRKKKKTRRSSASGVEGKTKKKPRVKPRASLPSNPVALE
eukprot:COSAG01_NODE_12022_length_1814_cov_3.041983_3_plen_379_part_00